MIKFFKFKPKSKFFVRFNLSKKRSNEIILNVINKVNIDSSKSLEENLILIVEKLGLKHSNEIDMITSVLISSFNKIKLETIHEN